MTKKLIFLTRSTMPAALADSAFNTSSQAYEVNLITSLAGVIDVTVVYIGKADDCKQRPRRRPFTIHLPEGSVEYFFFGSVGPFAFLKFSRFLIALAIGRESVVITTGYYPNEMTCLACVRSDRLKTYSIVFDTHRQGNSLMPLPKRWLANVYFETGFFLLRYLSGIVVLNDAFIFSRKLRIRYHKTKIGKLFYGEANSNLRMRASNDQVLFLFAGTLNADNGVRLILDYLHQHRTQNMEVWFFGYGEFLDEIKNRELDDSRIKYGGVLNDQELDRILTEHDYLLCLRDPESSVCQYAFPSKLIKFMGSGVPVICNVFPGLDPVYQNHLLLLKEYSVVGLADVLNTIQMRRDVRALGASSKEYIEKNHGWSTISPQMMDFLFASDPTP